jgi:hypothetical protein
MDEEVWKSLIDAEFCRVWDIVLVILILLLFKSRVLQGTYQIVQILGARARLPVRQEWKLDTVLLAFDRYNYYWCFCIKYLKLHNHCYAFPIHTCPNTFVTKSLSIHDPALMAQTPIIWEWYLVPMPTNGSRPEQSLWWTAILSVEFINEIDYQSAVRHERIHSRSYDNTVSG